MRLLLTIFLLTSCGSGVVIEQNTRATAFDSPRRENKARGFVRINRFADGVRGQSARRDHCDDCPNAYRIGGRGSDVSSLIFAAAVIGGAL